MSKVIEIESFGAIKDNGSEGVSKLHEEFLSSLSQSGMRKHGNSADLRQTACGGAEEAIPELSLEEDKAGEDAIGEDAVSEDTEENSENTESEEVMSDADEEQVRCPF